MKNHYKGIYTKALLLTAIIPFLLISCTIKQAIQEGYYSVNLRGKGNYYLDKKKYREGIKAFEGKLKTNPDSGEAHYYMGRFLLATEHHKKGLSHLEKAVNLAPKKADYHFWLGVAYAANKRRGLERKSYLRALKLDKKHVQALTYLGHNQLEKAEYEDALKTYTKVLQLWPYNPSALYNRALILKHFKRTPEEKLAWREYLDVSASGPMARQAVRNLNALGDFEYRNHLLGVRSVTLQKTYFEPFTEKINEESKSSLEVLGNILKNNDKIAIHILAYQKNNKNLAKARTKSIKKYLLKNFPKIKSSRLMVSWFDVPEKIKIGKKTFSQEESINFITAVGKKQTKRSTARWKK